MITCEPRHRPSSETGYNRNLRGSLRCKTGCQKYRRNTQICVFRWGPSHLDLARPRLAGPPISPRRRTDASAARSGRTSLLHHAPLPIPLITLTLTLSLSLLTSSSGAHTLVSTVFSFGGEAPPSPPGPALKTRVDREKIRKSRASAGNPRNSFHFLEISWKVFETEPRGKMCIGMVPIMTCIVFEGKACSDRPSTVDIHTVYHCVSLNK